KSVPFSWKSAPAHFFIGRISENKTGFSRERQTDFRLHSNFDEPDTLGGGF
ncbi:hypothetical protein LINPERHAP2_LOCUS20721, partial [Linum perenne]